MLENLHSILSKNRSNQEDSQSTWPQSVWPESVWIEGQEIPLQWNRNKRSRSISLRADVINGVIKISLPLRASSNSAMQFIDRKKQWLASRFETAPRAIPIKDKTEIAFEGEPHQICWDEKLGRKIIYEPGLIQLGGPKDHIQNRIIRWLKEQARIIFMDDIRHYCEIAGSPTPRLSIGDARGRWGSCSTRGTIRLNWRLVMAPSYVRCSVIAHEVAHIKHMNHSAVFYQWLDTIYEGDRHQADQWLKQHGTGLYMVGQSTTLSG